MRALLQRLRAAFEGLASRERLLVGAVGVLLAFCLLWLLLVQPLLGVSDHYRTRVTAAEGQLEAMKRLRRDFDDVNERVTSVEARVQGARSGNLRTTLETLARAASVRIESMEPQSAPAHDRYRETKVEVGLEQVSLPQTIRYLHEIETTDQVLSIKALRMRTRPDRPELLDVTFTVSSFEPL